MEPSTYSHGWVTPRADRRVAKCGGPCACRECKAEFRAKHGREWSESDDPRTATRLGADARATRKP